MNKIVLLASITSLFCLGASVRFGRFTCIALSRFAIVRGVKPASLKDYSDSLSDKLLYFSVTLRAFI
jgi:hypothetical protein